MASHRINFICTFWLLSIKPELHFKRINNDAEILITYLDFHINQTNKIDNQFPFFFMKFKFIYLIHQKVFVNAMSILKLLNHFFLVPQRLFSLGNLAAVQEFRKQLSVLKVPTFPQVENVNMQRGQCFHIMQSTSKI